MAISEVCSLQDGKMALPASGCGEAWIGSGGEGGGGGGGLGGI